jgi:anti-sigma regulatory factor (Ser/Thr protein kinase)
LSTTAASFDLLPAPPSIQAARHLVLELLRAWDAPQDRDDAALLVTELVANVVDHVGGNDCLTLEVEASGERLRIAVLDGSSIPPVVQELAAERPRGRGLLMVQQIAERWGSEERPGGKRVWFELGPAEG